jgi:transposase
MATYIGVDYHLAYSYMTVMDEAGRITARGRVANDREAVKQFLSRNRNGGRSAGVMEATRNWTVMYDLLEELVGEIHLAHLLRCDLPPEAYVPGEAARVARNVLRQRMFFVRVRTVVKNRIRRLLDRYPELATS